MTIRERTYFLRQINKFHTRTFLLHQWNTPEGREWFQQKMYWPTSRFLGGKEKNNNIDWLFQVSLINEGRVPLTTFGIICSLTFFRLCYLPKQSIIIPETESASCTADIPHFLLTRNFCQICPKSNSTKERAYIKLLHKLD